MIELYGFDPLELECKPCLNAKRLLDTRMVDYVFLPIAKISKTEEHKVNKADLTRRAKEHGVTVTSMPQAFIDGQYIGGFEELKAWVNENA
ncbi:glutaredoxin [Aeromonas phage avDM12-TAAL]|nr:glutaredoxin [Aeromonas phage avDM12-TAAL]